MELSTLTLELRTCLGLQKAATIAIIGTAFTVATESAEATAIKQFVIEDVGSTVGGSYSTILDGNSGGFSFSAINPANYLDVTGFNTDTGIPMAWQGNIQGPNVFTSGFNFAGVDVDVFTYGTINSTAPGSPFTGTGAIGDITGGALTVTSLDWGAGPLSSGNVAPYPQGPDPSSFQVNWVTPGVNSGEYLVSMQWSHLITTAEDPSGDFIGFTTNWILEGTATLVPIPPAAWLFVSGLLGLVGVARHRKS